MGELLVASRRAAVLCTASLQGIGITLALVFNFMYSKKAFYAFLTSAQSAALQKHRAFPSDRSDHVQSSLYDFDGNPIAQIGPL